MTTATENPFNTKIENVKEEFDLKKSIAKGAITGAAPIFGCEVLALVAIASICANKGDWSIFTEYPEIPVLVYGGLLVLGAIIGAFITPILEKVDYNQAQEKKTNYLDGQVYHPNSEKAIEMKGLKQD